MTELPDGRVTSSPRETKIFRGIDDDFGLKRLNHHLGPEYMHLFRAKKSIVYGETFQRNFNFYAKTLTKLHDLTVIHYGSGSGSTRQKVTVPTVPVPQHWLLWLHESSRGFTTAQTILQ